MSKNMRLWAIIISCSVIVFGSFYLVGLPVDWAAYSGFASGFSMLFFMRAIQTVAFYRNRDNDYPGRDDVTQWQSDMPEKIAQYSEHLSEQGWTYLGAIGLAEKEDKVPDGWIYIDKQTTTACFLRPTGIISYLTLFQSGRWQNSGFSVSKDTLGDALDDYFASIYSKHREKVRKAIESRDEIEIVINTLAEFIDWRAEYGLQIEKQTLAYNAVFLFALGTVFTLIPINLLASFFGIWGSTILVSLVGIIAGGVAIFVSIQMRRQGNNYVSATPLPPGAEPMQKEGE